MAVIPGANVFARSPDLWVIGHKLDGPLDLAHIHLCLVVAPSLAGVVPDLIQIGLGGGGECTLTHCPCSPVARLRETKGLLRE